MAFIFAHLAFAAADIFVFAVSLMVRLAGFASTGELMSATGAGACATGFCTSSFCGFAGGCSTAATISSSLALNSARWRSC